MIDFREDLKRKYRRNIESAKDELRYYYSEIRRVQHIINENTVMLNSLKYSQLSLKDLLGESEVLNATN